MGNKIYKNSILYQISHDEGRIVDKEYEYNIKDHLGNTRVSFRDKGGAAEITQVNHVGAWGESLESLTYQNTPKVNNFTVSTYEKENDFGIGVMDAHARIFDPITPRFWSQDIMSEKYYGFSNYGFVFNNPLKYIDPNGEEIDIADLLKNKEHAEAFILFAKTKEGNAFLMNYASKGQKLEYKGNVFFEAKSAGKYDKVGIDLHYFISKNNDAMGSSTTGGDGVISKDVNVEISTTGFGTDSKIFNLVEAITHESLLHANSRANDMEDGRRNYSNLPQEYRQYRTHADHYYVGREYLTNPNNSDVKDFPVNGLSILRQASKQLNLNYSEAKIKTVMWDFNGSVINVNPKNGKLTYKNEKNTYHYCKFYVVY